MSEYENLITQNGNHGPFVYRDEAGIIHVGDDDNDDEFETIAEAVAHVKKFRLRGGALSTAWKDFKLPKRIIHHEQTIKF